MKTNSYAFKPLLMATMLGATSLSYAQSEDATDDKFRLAGFASIVYAKTLDNDASDDYAGNGPTGDLPNEETGEYRDFNRLGLRLDVDLDDKLSFAAQMLAAGDKDYDPEFDWIAATYSITPNISVTVGKTVAPLYMYSDYLDTSYAYQWVTAPYAVYGAGTAKSTEGVRINWRADMGGAWSSDLTVWNGKTQEPLPELSGEDLIAEGSTGVAWEVEREWLTLRGVYFEGKTSANLTHVLKDYTDLVYAASSNTLDLTQLESYDDLLWEDEKATFIGFGIGLDFETVFFNAEGTVVEAEENIAIEKLESWYAMIGTRLPGNVTISLTYSEDNDDFNEETVDNFYNEIENLAGTATADTFVKNGTPLPSPPFPVDALPSLESVIKGQQFNETQNYTFTTRWDFHRSASLKFEYYNSEITLHDTTNSEEFTKKPKAFAIGLDLVF